MANDIQSPEDQAALNESLDLISKEPGLEDIPAYNLAKSLGLIEVGKQVADMAEWQLSTINQALFDIGSQAYNLSGVPLNKVGEFFGYNPGFSGERFMQQVFPLASPREDVDRPWGDTMWGSEGAQVPFREQALGGAVRDIFDSNISAPVTTVKPDTVAVNPYTEVWEEYLTMPEENQASIFNQLTKEEQNALTQYVEEKSPLVTEK